MTFKHKLSKRLAMLRGVARGCALLAMACITPPGDRLGGPNGSIARVVIIPDSVVAQPHQEVEFMAVGLTAGGDTANVAVRWKVTDGTITEVGLRAGRAYGRYKANKPGKHHVEVTDSGGRVDTGTVDVPVPVSSVSVSPGATNLTVGQTTQLTAALRDSAGDALSGRMVTWSSANAGVATVNGAGLVTATGAGSSTITATSEGKSGTSSVTVTLAPVASVSVSPSAPTVGRGQTVQLTVTLRDAAGNVLSGRTVTWATSAGGIASVSASGLVTGVAGGTATITASSEGRDGTASVTVTEPVATVTVTPATASVQAGSTVQLTATPRDTNGNTLSGRTITWSSSNTTMATVSAGGVVTARTAGSATITATSEGRSGTSAITVTPAPVASVTVSPATTSVAPGGTVQLSATPRDANGNALTGRVVSWASGAPGIATVSASGLVTGVAAGSAVISATSEGVTGTATVSVASAGGSYREPPGLTRVSDRVFDAKVEDGWTDAGYSGFSIVTDPSAPRSPSSVGQARYPAGYASGSAPMHTEKRFGGGRRVYIRFWVKFSSNWDGNDSYINKILYAWIAAGPRIYLQAAGSGGSPLYARVNTQGPGADYTLGGSVAEIVRGRWHLFEVLLTANSAGGVDSKIQGWLDGVEFVNFTGTASSPLVMWQSGESSTWEAVAWTPVYGGGGAAVPAEQFQWIDHIYVSTGN